MINSAESGRTKTECPAFTDAPTAALEYLQRGWWSIPIPRGKKRAVLPKWSKLRLTAEKIPAAFRGQSGIGILLGAPSGNLTDVDLDSPEAVVLGRRWLPETGMVHGRPGRPSSHYWYVGDEALRRETFEVPVEPGEERVMLVEIRGDGHQTVVPPSLHPSGEVIVWERFGTPARVSLEDLRLAVRLVSAGSLLARFWLNGHRHDATLPLAGYVLRHGWSEDQTAGFLDGMAEAVGADRDKVAADVHDTAERINKGETATGWPTLLKYFPEKVLDRAFSWLDISRDTLPFDPGTSFESGESGWGEPRDLPALSDPVPTLELELIPVPLRGWLGDVSERLCAPLEWPALPAVAALASVVGRNVAIRPKKLDNWELAMTIWGAVVGPPGTLKSPAIREAMRPLERLAKKAHAEFSLECAGAGAEFMVRDARIKAVKDKLAEVVKQNRETEIRSLQSQLKELLFQQTEANEPAEHRYLTNDSTTEKLGILLNQNPRGLFVLRDELVGWLYALQKQGRETDRAFFLESWNGLGSFNIDRIGRGSLRVEALTLSIFGSIQPDRLTGFFSGAMSEGGEMDGLLQRFQLVAWPDSVGDWRVVDHLPDTEAFKRAFDVFQKLDALVPGDIGAEVGKDGDIPFFRFANEAQELFFDWWTKLMKRVRSPEGQKTPGFTAHLAKYPALLPKLALLFHLVEVVDGASQGPVGLEAARRAAGWVEFLEAHARKIYAPELRTNVAAANALAGRIRAGAIKDGMSVRDIYRREWTGLKTSGAVFGGLEVLDEAGWAKIEELPKGAVIRLNPSLGGGR
jgi:hypothetical protein